MSPRVHYPSEIKWKAVKMKLEGHPTKFIMQTLGIKNVSQIKTWMKWYYTNQVYRFDQPVGKQYAYQKGPAELTEIEQLKLRVRQIEMQNELLGKLNGILRELQKLS
jgi:transposase-like protein